MSNMTLSLPDDVRKQMKDFPEVKWSHVARQAIIERLETLRVAEKIANKKQVN